MNILIAYETREGHTRQAADAIAQAARELGHTVEVKPVWQVLVNDVRTADALFIGTWVMGLILLGVQPARARRWVPTLPRLEGKPVAMFCTYGINPRNALNTLARLLKAQGAEIIGQHAFHHNQPTEGAAEFVRSVLEPAHV